MDEVKKDDLVNTPHGIGIVDARDSLNSLIKYLPTHDPKWHAPCEFKLINNSEITKVEEK